MIKTQAKLVGKYAVLIFLSVLGATLLMAAVYALPVGRMKNHVAQSSAIFDYEGVYPQIFGGYKASQLDNCTDSIMLANAIYPGQGESVFVSAMNNTQVLVYDELPTQSLNDYANDVKGKDIGMGNYPRYWHGYLVFLKPLLLFFNFGDIRYINMLLQGGLLFCLFILLFRCGKEYLAGAFFLTAAVLNPVAEALSLQFSSVYYITLLMSIAVLGAEYFIRGGVFERKESVRLSIPCGRYSYQLL